MGFIFLRSVFGYSFIFVLRKKKNRRQTLTYMTSIPSYLVVADQVLFQQLRMHLYWVSQKTFHKLSNDLFKQNIKHNSNNDHQI